MKTTLFLILALALNLSLCPPTHAEESQVPVTISFDGVTAVQVLDVYKKLTRLELVTATNVRRDDHRIKLRTTSPVSAAAAQQFLEQALLKQAGIIITRLDDKRASVTYNDRLVVTAAD